MGPRTEPAGCRETPAKHPRQAIAPAASGDPPLEPFSDFNAVKAAKPIPFPDRPTPDSLPERGQLRSIFSPVNTIGWSEGGDWVRRFITRNPKRASRSATGARQVAK